jgi:hypothetical protein
MAVAFEYLNLTQDMLNMVVVAGKPEGLSEGSRGREPPDSFATALEPRRGDSLS